MNIYPNPSSDYISIEASSTVAKSQLSVLDVEGRQMISCQFTEPKMKIDIRNLPNGVYFVRLTGDKVLRMGKFVKE